jgi:hypothetical protein
MAQQRVACRQPSQRLTLDRRNPHSQALAHLLWQLHLIGAQGITPHATHTAASSQRHLLTRLLHEEHWTLSDHPRWLPSLIEAAAYGATLPQAARACLLRSVPVLHATSSAEAVVMALTRVFTDAIRAGFFDLGDEMAEVLQQQIPLVHDHAALAQAMHQLLDVMQAGFWGQDTRPLLHQGLQAMTTRLLYLIEQLALHPPQPNAKHSVVYLNHSEADVLAVQVIARLVAQPDAQTVWPTSHLLGSLLRHARALDKPPALRGAALGVVYAQRDRSSRSSTSSTIDLAAEPSDTTDATQATPTLSDDELLRVMAGLDSTTALGDALYGLFAVCRDLFEHDVGLLRMLQHTIAQMTNADFLHALPALRGAFGWFPPRERGKIALQLAQLLGLSLPERTLLTQLPASVDVVLLARHTEALVNAWLQDDLPKPPPLNNS